MKFAPTAWLLMLLGLVSGACDRGASPSDEVAAELRALRLALRDARPQPESATPAAREALHEALGPLREVLTQLGSAQRELATRQTALNQELQRWTQLVVSAMQEKPAAEGRELQQRLEQLEQSMALQDARHREVETLLQGALDDTTSHLEDFLRRLQQVAPDQRPEGTSETGQQAPGAAAPGSGGAAGGEAGAGSGTPVGGSEPTVNAPVQPAARRGASRWPWWVLAGVAVVMGVRLLLPRRRSPLAVAPEMRAAPHTLPQPEASPAPLVAADEALGEPEVEELWAAAALLGEAIGKIRQSASPHEVERLLGAGIGDAADAARQTNEAGDEQQSPVRSVRPATAGEPHGSKPDGPACEAAPGEVVAAEQHEFDDELFVLDEFVLDDVASQRVSPAGATHPSTGCNRQPDELEAGKNEPPDEREPGVWLPRAESEHPASAATAAARTPAAILEPPDSVTCRLPVRDAPQAERAVRRVLDADPRVLVQPAPEVRPSGSELWVVFALLPGLSSGERSQLEQRLRDAVA